MTYHMGEEKSSMKMVISMMAILKKVKKMVKEYFNMLHKVIITMIYFPED